jgi:two-component system, sensor histidine kinase ChiS
MTRFILCLNILIFVSACANIDKQEIDLVDADAIWQPALLEEPEEMPFILAALADQSQAIHFQHIPPEAGLSQSVVQDLLQDDQGFMWLATQDGLNRYDGYVFKFFKHVPGELNSLSGDFISSLTKDQAGRIWIGSHDGGLNYYDPKSGQFGYYLHDPLNPISLSENSVSAVEVDQDGIVWVGTNNNGLNRLDPVTGHITRFLFDPEVEGCLSSNLVSTISVDGNGGLWVGTWGGGLNYLDPVSGVFTHYQNNPEDTSSISSNDIQSIYFDQQGDLWVGTYANGLNRLDPETGSFDRLMNIPGIANSLSHNSVTTIFEDRNGHFWIATAGGGIDLYDRQAGSFTHFQHNPYDPDSLSNNTVMSIFEDDAGILWFGTFGSGVDYYDPFKRKFLHIRSNPQNPNSLSSNSLWKIYEDTQGFLWVCTNDQGLNRFDPSTREWAHFRHIPDDPNSLGHDTVYTIYQDYQGEIWIGVVDALNRFEPLTGTFQHYATPTIFNIYEDSQGDFWLGSAFGLIKFDRETSTMDYFSNDPQDPTSLSSNFVSLIFEDDQQNFWVGTLNGGLNLFDRQSGNFTRFMSDSQDPNSLSNNSVLMMHQARNGVLWLGTGGGLNKFDPQDGIFTAFREKDGLPNELIYGMLEDERGYLWLSTNKGISLFDPELQMFRNYDLSDGLQGLEFNQWSFFQNKDGVMYFGGVNGMNIFHPGYVRDNPYIPSVVITGFEIHQQPVLIGPDSPLKQPVEFSQEVQLSFRDDFFGFHYAALHYSAPEKIQYAYILEDLDRGWNHVENRRYVNYTNVPPGEYTFRVKATNADGVWTNQGAALRIIIPPPFWQTTWFRLLAVVGLVAGIYAVFSLRLQVVENQRRHLENQVQERTHALNIAMHELERSSQKMESELELAAKVQASFIRRPLPKISGLQLSVALMPAKLTSGDYYDVIQYSDKTLGLLIADVVDKGVGAALYMAMSCALLRTYSMEQPDHPEIICRQVNERLLEYASASQFVTVFLGGLDSRSGKLIYTNAGHNPPVLVRQSEPVVVQLLRSRGVPLGVLEDADWMSDSVYLNPGDSLILYTDGITEAESQDHEYYGIDRLLDIARQNAGKSAVGIRDAILSSVQQFTIGTVLEDDIALVVLVRDVN